MSLSSLNQPSLISAAGVALGASFSALKSPQISFAAIQLLQGAAYTVNLVATSQPGRLDGEAMRDNADEGLPSSKFVPSPWAFAIWGPIFLGELVYCIASAVTSKNSKHASIIRDAAPGFIASQLFQALWAAAFRPKYYKSKSWPAFVSASLLSGIAWSLSQSHSVIASSSLSGTSYFLYGLPLTLHFGWTTAASLVNLNGSIAATSSKGVVVAAAGYASPLVAASLGVYVTLQRKAPVFGSVIAWALTACATSGRQQQAEDRVQKWLCAGGAIATAVAVATTVVGRK